MSTVFNQSVVKELNGVNQHEVHYFFWNCDCSRIGSCTCLDVTTKTKMSAKKRKAGEHCHSVSILRFMKKSCTRDIDSESESSVSENECDVILAENVVPPGTPKRNLASENNNSNPASPVTPVSQRKSGVDSRWKKDYPWIVEADNGTYFLFSVTLQCTDCQKLLIKWAKIS